MWDSCAGGNCCERSGDMCKAACNAYFALPPSPPLSQIEYGPEGQSIGDCAEWCGNAVMGRDAGGADTCALGSGLLDTTPGMEMRCGFVASPCGAGLEDTGTECSFMIDTMGCANNDVGSQCAKSCACKDATIGKGRCAAFVGKVLTKEGSGIKDYALSGGGIDFTLMSEHSQFYASDKPCKIDTYEVKVPWWHSHALTCT